MRDEKTGLTIKVLDTSLCPGSVGAVDSGPAKMMAELPSQDSSSATELLFTCEESEALYSIGFQKVNENCKREKVISAVRIDWGVCLHSYYPWVNILHTKVCVLKNDLLSDFLACFCTTDESGNIVSRGFCITKVECLMGGQALNLATFAELEVDQTCLTHIRYFLEANARDSSWLSRARKQDKLRVRAPYHPDSPCYGKLFSGFFDIGQLEFVDLLNGKVEVLTPFKMDDIEVVINEDGIPVQKIEKNNIPNEKIEEDPGSCVPIPEETRDRMNRLSFFFEERIIADSAIWLPGIIFVYSTLLSNSEEKGPLMKLIMWLAQFSIVSIGFYNTSVAFLPEAYFIALEEFRRTQLYMFLFSFLLSPIFCINSSQASEHFLKVSMISFIPDIALWKVTQVMYTEERFENYKILIKVWFFAMLAYTVYKLSEFLKECFCQNNAPNNRIDVRRSNSKNKKKETKKINKSTTDETFTTKSPVQRKRNNKSSNKKQKTESTFSIVCQYKCHGILNVGYVSVNCTETCFNQFHLQCWAKFLEVQRLEHETALLGNDCLTQACAGRIFEIVWVDKFGIETSRKYVYADLSTVQHNSKQRGKGKQKDKLTRSISDTSGSSDSRVNYEEKIPTKPNPIQQSHPPLKQSKSLDLRPVERAATPQQSVAVSARNGSKSYASMVKNNNNNEEENIRSPSGANSINNSELLEEILELNCPEYFNQSCKLPEKSKILSLIAKSKQPDKFGVYRSASVPTSSALIFVPGAGAGSGGGGSVITNKAAPTEPRSGPAAASPGVDRGSAAAPVERRKAALAEAGPVSPFSRLMARHFPAYSVAEVDAAVREVTAATKLEETTIPLFRRMIGERLEQTNTDNEIYMSDEDEEDTEDECLICTELLRTELLRLTPCGHMFHRVCIKEWLNKDLTCPKCRAKVEIKS